MPIQPSTPQIPAHYRAIAGSERHPAQAARREGPADPNETLQVTIQLRRRPDGPPAPDFDAVAAVPLAQRRPLSRDDFAAKYGAHPDDLAKVVDFGLVKAVEQEEDEHLTSTGQVLGTPQYMPPEQAGGEAVDQRSDLFSLTGVFFFCLTGHSPYGTDRSGA